MTQEPKHSKRDSPLERNIASIHNTRKLSDDRRRVDQVIIDRTASTAGSPASLYGHLLFYGAWTAYLVFLHERSSPQYMNTANEMGLFATVEAIFLATLVLINQRRMNHLERRNADLHLQMSMLSEHEITRIARVLDLVARKVGVNADSVESFSEVKEDVDPNAVLEKISQLEDRLPTDSTKLSGHQNKSPIE